MLPVLGGDVGHVGHPEERHQMMLAQGVERDVAHQDHLLMSVGADGIHQRGEVLGLAGDKLFVQVRDPARGLQKAFALGVLAYPFEEEACGLLDLLPVDHLRGQSSL